MNHIILFLLFFATVYHFTGSITQVIDHQLNGPIAYYLIRNFGLAQGGIIYLEYKTSAVDDTLPLNAYTLILLINDKQHVGFYKSLENSKKKVTDPNSVSNLCMQPSLERIVLIGATSGSYNLTIDSSYGADLYSVILLQCRTFSTNDFSSVNFHISFYLMNPRPPSLHHSQHHTSSKQPSYHEYTHFPIEQVTFLSTQIGILIAVNLLTLAMLYMIITM
jgi:hypothetical protein